MYQILDSIINQCIYLFLDRRLRQVDIKAKARNSAFHMPALTLPSVPKRPLFLVTPSFAKTLAASQGM